MPCYTEQDARTIAGTPPVLLLQFCDQKRRGNDFAGELKEAAEVLRCHKLGFAARMFEHFALHASVRHHGQRSPSATPPLPLKKLKPVTRRNHLPSPAVVMDWNLIRAMPSSNDVPPEYHCIVPDHVFHEKATSETTDTGDPIGLMHKFHDWAARNAARLWYGRTREDLVDRQWATGGRPLSMQDVVHPTLTDKLRQFAERPSDDLGNFVRIFQGCTSINHRLNDIRLHVRICDEFAKSFQTTYPHRSLGSTKEQEKMIRGPDLIKPFLNGPYHFCWRPEWDNTLLTDSNRFAIARWARFFAWYCMRRAHGEKGKFKNNFDDAMYGLLASYTDHLGTHDEGLKRAVKAIFPGVMIVDPLIANHTS